MLVMDWMSKTLITVDANDSMHEAMKLLKEKNIGMLPVMKNGNLVGVITDRDLKQRSPSDATTLEVHELLYLVSKIKVKEIMTEDPVTVPVDHTVEETAQVLLNHGISGVPVVDSEGKPVGVITKTDLFKVLISLTGVGKRGIQFAFQLEDRPGSIKEIADIIRKHGGRMVSILTAYKGVPKGFRRVYIRVYGLDRVELPQIEKAFKETATLLYMVDHRENKRRIY